MCQILLLLLGSDLRKLYSDGGRGKGGTNKSEVSLAAGKYEGKREILECHFMEARRAEV